MCSWNECTCEMKRQSSAGSILSFFPKEERILRAVNQIPSLIQKAPTNRVTWPTTKTCTQCNIYFHDCRTSSTTCPALLCVAECCRNPLVPYQSTKRAVMQSTQQEVGNKKEIHTLNTKWYKEFAWIHVCVTQKAIICYNCMHAVLWRDGIKIYKRYGTQAS